MASTTETPPGEAAPPSLLDEELEADEKNEAVDQHSDEKKEDAAEVVASTETFDDMYTGEATSIPVTSSEDTQEEVGSPELTPPTVDGEEDTLDRLMSMTSIHSDDSDESELPPPPPADAYNEQPFDEAEDIVGKPVGTGGVTMAPPSETAPTRDYSMYKTKVAARLDKAVDDAALEGNLRSPDLVPLTKEYHLMRKKLRSMILAAKDYQKYIRKLDASRSKMFDELSVLAKETPLDKHVGKKLDASTLSSIEQQGDVAVATTDEGLELQTDSAGQMATDLGGKSLASLQQVITIHTKLSEEEFQNHVLDYMLEWGRVVTKRVDDEIRDVRNLQNKKVHYERKVDGLRAKITKLENKGKPVPDQQTEKLARNEEKLNEAWQIHEERASDLAVLLEEVTVHHWKDLYPLLKNTMKWEVNRLSRETVTFGKLPSTLDAMKATFQDEVWTMKNTRDHKLPEV